jgi:hypothetical protein
LATRKITVPTRTTKRPDRIQAVRFMRATYLSSSLLKRVTSAPAAAIRRPKR